MIDESPIFNFNDNLDILTISGISIMEDPSSVWLPFNRMFKIWAEKRKKFTIEFKFKGFNSATSLYITMVVKASEELAKTKAVIINWYFCEADEDSEFKGEVYQDMTKKAKFNMVSVPGYKL